ncbi:hypothetical protein [Acidomonas methanolica]|uniref:hypothetical protein n=1 Tax=Acidomonas methanolica TaxID=437 RepID=UPI00211A766A|nr:hypothetical protein [Acidomonas methanolica]
MSSSFPAPKGRAARLLLATTVLAPVAYAAPAKADQLSEMEHQIKVMQAQLASMRKEHDREMKHIHQQLATQRQNEVRNPYAARGAYGGVAVPPGMAAGMMTANGPVNAPLLPPSTANTPYGQISGTPTARVLDLYGPLHRGQLQIGGIRVTLGGFAEAATFFRSRDMTSGISSQFGPGGVPFANSPTYHMNEFHQSERQSRLAVLAEGNIVKGLRAQAYVETDFQGAGTSSNSRQSNSYVLRTRVFYGQLIDDADDFYVLGGQSWSMLTMFNHGMSARDEQVPLSIDAQYIPGFNWTRNSQIRVVKGFDHDHYHVGLSVENPQQVISIGPGGNYLPHGATSDTYQNAGGNVFNSATNYSTDVAPDVIAKAVADPGWGHFEVYGLLRFPHSRVSYLGYGKSKTYVAGGGGAAMLLPLEKAHKVNFQVSGLVGSGIGRYGTSNMPDVTMSQSGHVKPLPGANVLAGIYGNPTKTLQLYAYGGLEMVRSRSYFNVGGKHYGYGNPLYDVAGCDIEGAAGSTCQTSINKVVQGTAGLWWTYLHGDYGTVKLGAQYSYTYVTSFSGVGGTPHSDDNMVFMSMRYYPFN